MLLRNNTSVAYSGRKENGDIELMYGGEPYLFPAGKVVEVDDPTVAKWFISKTIQETSPKQGRLAAEFPISQATLAPGKMHEDGSASPGEVPAFRYVFIEAPPPDPMEEARAAYKQHGEPRKGAPVTPADVQARMEREAISATHPDILLKEGRKRGVYKKGMEKAALVDALHKSGFKAPKG